MSEISFESLVEAHYNGEDTIDNYISLYSMVTDLISGLMNLWKKGNLDIFANELAVWAHALNRSIRRMKGRSKSVEFEIARMSGIIEVYQLLYRREQEQAAIERALVDTLKYSKQSSRMIINCLSKEKQTGIWIACMRLEEETKLSTQALSNIMRRLVASGAVEELKEGRSKKYRLTESGIRYSDKYLQQNVDSSEILQEEILRYLQNIQKDLRSIHEDQQGMREHFDRKFDNVEERLDLQKETLDRSIEYNKDNSYNLTDIDSSFVYDKTPGVKLIVNNSLPA